MNIYKVFRTVPGLKLLLCECQLIDSKVFFSAVKPYESMTLSCLYLQYPVMKLEAPNADPGGSNSLRPSRYSTIMSTLRGFSSITSLSGTFIKGETQKSSIKLNFARNARSSGQHGGIGKHGPPPSTTIVKITTKLQNNYHPELSESQAVWKNDKELKKSHSSRQVGGVEMWNK